MIRRNINNGIRGIKTSEAMKKLNDLYINPIER